MSLAPIARHLNRDRGAPSADDFQAAGMSLGGGSVVRGMEFIGLQTEFGIVGRVYDKSTQRMHTGRFLVQWTDSDGEVLHHSYKRTP